MSRIHTAARITPLVAALCLLPGVDAFEAPPSARWDAQGEAFVEADFVAHPDAAVRAGRHEYDGKLPDWGRAGLDREVARLKAAKEKALSFDPAPLDERRRFERDSLLAVVDRNLFWLSSAGWPFKNPYFYELALDPNVY